MRWTSAFQHAVFTAFSDQTERARRQPCGFCLVCFDRIAAPFGWLAMTCLVRDAARLRRWEAAAANRILIEAGFAVSALVPKTRTLEDVYRSVVDEGALDEKVAA